MMNPTPHIQVESHVALEERLERIEMILSDLRDGMTPSIGMRIVRAAATSFGAILGATILVAIALAVLQPFTKVEIIGDKIDRLINALEKPSK